MLNAQNWVTMMRNVPLAGFWDVVDGLVKRTVTLFAEATHAVNVEIASVLACGTPRDSTSPTAAPVTGTLTSEAPWAGVDGKSMTAVALRTLRIAVPPPTVRVPA